MFYLGLRQLALRGSAYFLVCVVVAEVSERVSGDRVISTSSNMQQQKKTDSRIPPNGGLLLYYDRFSFYSQKVVMALHEKKLPFENKLISLFNSEQYQPWFLNLNPRGEVPVLQDTGKIIPDSARIIDYLEDNFSNGDTPRLIPMDQGPEIRQKVIHFRQLLQKTPEGMLTTGSVLHQHFLKNPKIPFLAPVRSALASAEKDGAVRLRQYAELNPEAKEVLMKKALAREERYQKLLVEKNFKEVLEEVHQILGQVEEELSKHTGDKEDWWLCSDRFTIADVELSIVLLRIDQLGLEEEFWSSGKRPYIEKYYEKVKLRDSLKKTVPGTFVFLKTVLMSQAPILVGVVTAVAVVIGGVVIAKRYFF